MNLVTVLFCLALAPAARAQLPAPAPANPDLDQAAARFRDGQPEEAFKLLQEAVKKTPTLPPARLMLARLYLNAGQTPQGRQHLEVAAAENPDHPEVFLVNGSLALAENRYLDTLLNCQTALTLATADRWTAEQKKGFQREARAGLAAVYERRAEWPAARAQLAAWLDLDPQNGPARQRLGRALFFAHKPDEAQVELAAAARADPTLAPAEVVLGQLSGLGGDAKKAAEWFQKAVAKYPDNARVHHAFGDWLLEQGRLDEARVHAETAGRLNSNLPEAARLRGLVARLAGDKATARQVFEGLHRASPGDFIAANQLALLLAEDKDEFARRRALELAEVNARQYPSNGEALATLGWIYYQLGRLDDADRVLGAALANGPVGLDVAYYLARRLQDRGKPDEARKLLQGALEGKGVFAYRKEAQALLEKLPAAKKPAEPGR